MTEPSTYSALMTVQTINICNGPGILTAVMLHPAAAAATITIYDNASVGSGNVIALIEAVSGGSTILIPYDSGIRFQNGATCVVTGTSAQAQIYYQRT